MSIISRKKRKLKNLLPKLRKLVALTIQELSVELKQTQVQGIVRKYNKQWIEELEKRGISDVPSYVNLYVVYLKGAIESRKKQDRAKNEEQQQTTV